MRQTSEQLIYEILVDLEKPDGTPWFQPDSAPPGSTIRLVQPVIQHAGELNQPSAVYRLEDRIMELTYDGLAPVEAIVEVSFKAPAYPDLAKLEAAFLAALNAHDRARRRLVAIDGPTDYWDEDLDLFTRTLSLSLEE